MNCPDCGAPMHLKPDEDSLTCDYCHTVYFPEKDDNGVRVLGEAAAETCPNCNVPLVQAALAQVRILYCTKCHGELISMHVFERLVDQLRSEEGGTMVQPPPDSRDLSRRIDCPHCHRVMETHLYAGPGTVVIESCEECLLNWLDRGELMRIVHAPDSRSNPETFLDTAPRK
jgi:Zn-finger nucleic acid-binding protein